MTASTRIEAPVRGVLYHSREVKGTGQNSGAGAQPAGERRPSQEERRVDRLSGNRKHCAHFAEGLSASSKDSAKAQRPSQFSERLHSGHFELNYCAIADCFPYRLSRLSESVERA